MSAYIDGDFIVNGFGEVIGKVPKGGLTLANPKKPLGGETGVSKAFKKNEKPKLSPNPRGAASATNVRKAKDNVSRLKSTQTLTSASGKTATRKGTSSKKRRNTDPLTSPYFEARRNLMHFIDDTCDGSVAIEDVVPIAKKLAKLRCQRFTTRR